MDVEAAGGLDHVAGQVSRELHAATRAAAHDRAGRERLCRYALRPPLANDHLHLLSDGSVQSSSSVPGLTAPPPSALAPTALIARFAALVPPPRRHVTRYFGVLSSHCKLRPLVVAPAAEALSACTSETPAEASDGGAGAGRRCRYISRAELLRRTFAIDLVCSWCGGDLRLIALVKTDDAIRKILTAMGLPAEHPLVHPAPTARSPHACLTRTHPPCPSSWGWVPIPRNNPSDRRRLSA